ncbi:hypothetical protein DUNSADRAFT_2420, partial [Dunaliella salina]
TAHHQKRPSTALQTKHLALMQAQEVLRNRYQGLVVSLHLPLMQRAKDQEQQPTRARELMLRMVQQPRGMPAMVMVTELLLALQRRRLLLALQRRGLQDLEAHHKRMMEARMSSSRFARRRLRLQRMKSMTRSVHESRDRMVHHPNRCGGVLRHAEVQDTYSCTLCLDDCLTNPALEWTASGECSNETASARCVFDLIKVVWVVGEGLFLGLTSDK